MLLNTITFSVVCFKSGREERMKRFILLLFQSFGGLRAVDNVAELHSEVPALSVSQQLSVGAQWCKTKEVVKAPKRCHGNRTDYVWIQIWAGRRQLFFWGVFFFSFFFVCLYIYIYILFTLLLVSLIFLCANHLFLY